MNNNINLTPEAERVIEGLRHPAGTLDWYRNTLTRVFNQVLHAAEDLGMDEFEALETLRTLDLIRCDLAALATTPATTGDETEYVSITDRCFRQLAETRYMMFSVMGTVEELESNPQLQKTVEAIERAICVIGSFNDGSMSQPVEKVKDEPDEDGLHELTDEELSHISEPTKQEKEKGGQQ